MAKTHQPSTTPDLAALKGLIPDGLGDRLTFWASQTEGPIVEVGSFKGKSTCYLAAGAVGRTVYAVDPWGLPGNVPGRFRFDQARTEFDRQTEPWPNITAIQGFSLDVAAQWDEPVGLVYVDGSHHYRDVLADLRAWAPWCSGPILCDDFGTPRNPGVKQAVDEWTKESGRKYTVEAERLAVVAPAV